MMITTMVIQPLRILCTPNDVDSDYVQSNNDADYEGSISSDYSGVSPPLVAFFSIACRLSTHLLLCWGYW